MLAAKLGASFLSDVVETIFWGKVVISVAGGMIRADEETIRAGNGTITTSFDF